MRCTMNYANNILYALVMFNEAIAYMHCFVHFNLNGYKIRLLVYSLRKFVWKMLLIWLNAFGRSTIDIANNAKNKCNFSHFIWVKFHGVLMHIDLCTQYTIICHWCHLSSTIVPLLNTSLSCKALTFYIHAIRSHFIDTL